MFRSRQRTNVTHRGERVTQLGTPRHLTPDACHVCGGDDHPDTTTTGGHKFWPNTDAQAEAEEADRRTRVRYPTGATTAEGAYIAQHRPY